ncbi:DNA polymerase eta [Sergentomyia squamirostris]
MNCSEVNLSNTYERIVVLVDMDCFYCQVEEKLNPEIRGKPMAVVQYNQWQGGGIIAVNYPARARGVTRHMRGDEAKKHCPEIELVRVPSVREKADLTKYRDAGKEVARVLQSFTPNLERASVDEAYLDITSNVVERMKAIDKGEYFIRPENVANTFAVGFKSFGEFVKSLSVKMSGNPGSSDSDMMEDFRAANASCTSEEKNVKKRNEIKLLVAATIVNDIRRAVKEETGYDCSAGVAHNKILAKIVAGLNKPNKQTIMSIDCVPFFFEDLQIVKVRGLGGKFGEIVCQKLDVKYMKDLLEFSENELRQKFNDKDGTWLYYLARGIDLEPVVTRLISKSIGCTKKFPGKGAITGVKTLTHWLQELAGEVVDRLNKDQEENNRKGKLLTVSFTQSINGEDIASSRSIQLDAYEKEKIADDAFEIIKKNTDVFYVVENPSILNNPIKLLGLSVGKFERNPLPKKNRIQEMFKKQEIKNKATEEDEKEKIEEPKPEEGFFQNYLEAGKQDERSQSPKPSTSKDIPVSPERKVEGNDCQNTSSDSKKSDGFFQEFLDQETEEILPELHEKAPEEPSEVNEVYEASTPEYKKTYAEFTRPQLPEEFMTVCEMCNKRISQFEANSHADYHLALKMSQDQRIEFRQSIKEKKPAPPAAKKMKMTKPSTNPTITKFLSNSQMQQSPGKPTELCSECGKQIPIDELVEHSDYHLAKRTQIELNRQENSAQKTIQPSQKKKNSKSGQKASSTGKSSKVPSIASFFSSNM